MLQASSAGLAALTLIAAVALAQTETAQIAGFVEDRGTSAIPNARVTAEAIDTRFVREATTSNAVVYAITNLPPGPYRISVEAEGFSVARQLADLPVGAKVAVDFALQIGPVNTVVDARAKTSATVNTETPTLGTWIDSKEIVAPAHDPPQPVRSSAHRGQYLGIGSIGRCGNSPPLRLERVGSLSIPENQR